MMQVEEKNGISEYQQRKIGLLLSAADDAKKMLTHNEDTKKNTDDLLSAFRKSKAYAIALGLTQIAQLVGIGFQLTLFFRETSASSDGEQ